MKKKQFIADWEVVVSASLSSSFAAISFSDREQNLKKLVIVHSIEQLMDLMVQEQNNTRFQFISSKEYNDKLTELPHRSEYPLIVIEGPAAEFFAVHITEFCFNEKFHETIYIAPEANQSGDSGGKGN